jgi:hypothetical protein
VQTAPVIPPGAFPNGQPGTRYIATVAPGELKFAEEEATRIWERTEAERQKTKEHEAAEQLQKCREEGGCGVESEDSCGANCVPVGGMVEIEGEVQLEGDNAVAAGRKPFTGEPVGVCKFKASVNVEDGFAIFQDRYQCTTNVNLTAWNFAGAVPGEVYKAGYTRGGVWESTVLNPELGSFQVALGLCVNIVWEDKRKPKKTGKCFTGRYVA